MTDKKITAENLQHIQTYFEGKANMSIGNAKMILLSWANAARDALELMKEQEAVEPYMDYDGQDVWRCGKCGNSLMHPSYYESDEDAKNHIRYCSHCGKAVKWDADAAAGADAGGGRHGQRMAGSGEGAVGEKHAAAAENARLYDLGRGETDGHILAHDQ